VGTVYENTNKPYPYWDDHKKSFQLTSTTCTECYFPCPPGSEVPPEEPGVNCELTGPGCVSSLSFCTTFFQPRQFQHCSNCTTYVHCAGFSGSSIMTCPDNTFWDDVAKDCLSSSTTCVECYTPCNETITTLGQTTEEPPTTPAAGVGFPGEQEGTTRAEPELMTTEQDGDDKEELLITTLGQTTEEPTAPAEEAGAWTTRDKSELVVTEDDEDGKEEVGDTTSSSAGCSAALVLSANVSIVSILLQFGYNF
jgi:hypothetical protein